MKKVLCLGLVLVFSQKSFADVKIKFPEEELSTESVLPVFEDTVAIKNRKVKHAGRFELNLMGGLVTSEPLYNPINFGGSLTYHFNNTSAIHILGAVFLGGLNSNGEDLRDGQVFSGSGTTVPITFDASKAPNKEFLLAAHYQYTAYYGKVSLTGDTVMNLTLSALVGGGAYLMGDLIAPAGNIGLSQRFYFNSNFALRFDILISAFSGPDITSAGPLNPNDPPPDSSEFDRLLQVDSNLFLGLSFLL